MSLRGRKYHAVLRSNERAHSEFTNQTLHNRYLQSSSEVAVILSNKFVHSGMTWSNRRAIVISDNNSIHKESVKSSVKHSIDRGGVTIFNTKQESDLVTLDF